MTLAFAIKDAISVLHACGIRPAPQRTAGVESVIRGDDHRLGNDDYTHAANLYWLIPANGREPLPKAIAGAMEGVTPWGSM